MNIRKAQEEDAPLLSRLNMHVQLLHADAYPDLFKTPDRVDFALPFFEMFLKDPDVHIYIADDPQPAGYLVCRVVNTQDNPFMFARSYLYIDQISVEPEYQGKGIGKALMKQASRLAEEIELSTIALDSWDFNVEAHAFFQSQGYELFNIRMWKR